MITAPGDAGSDGGGGSGSGATGPPQQSSSSLARPEPLQHGHRALPDPLHQAHGVPPIAGDDRVDHPPPWALAARSTLPLRSSSSQ